MDKCREHFPLLLNIIPAGIIPILIRTVERLRCRFDNAGDRGATPTIHHLFFM